MRETLILLSVAIVVLAVVITYRTATYGHPQPPRTQVRAALEVEPHIAAGLLSEALQIPTVSHSAGDPPSAQAFLRFHDYLETRFPRVHGSMRRENINNFSLLFTWEGTDTNAKPILFSAHMDVVPVEPGTESDWEYPAFSGAVADGYIWGRGALDMKSSLVAYMIAAEKLIEQGFEPGPTIYFAFGHDEEVGSQAAKAIAQTLKQRGVQLDFTLDEGLVITNGIVPGIDKPVALIGTAEKGLLTLEISGHSTGGHASLPPDNTLNERLARALVAVIDNPFEARLAAPAEQMFEYLGKDLSFSNRLVLANRWLSEPLLLKRLGRSPATNAITRTTVAPTIMESGFKSNVLPQVGRIAFSIRILPGMNAQDVQDHILRAVDDPSLVVRVVGNEPSDPSPISNLESESFAHLRQAIHDVFPDVLSAPSLLVGRTDSRRYAEIADNSYRFLPSRLSGEDLARLHGTNERIAVANFAEIVRFYARLIEISAEGSDQ